MPDPTTQQDEQKTARKSTAEPATSPVAEPAAVDARQDLYEPYPGAEFFHGGRHSEIIVAMARRLEAEGCTDGRYLGPDWTNAHRDAVARFQHQLRPKEGGDVSGIPDQVAWDKLHIPRVSPLPNEEA